MTHGFKFGLPSFKTGQVLSLGPTYQYILYYKLYCKIIYFNISKLTLCVFITEMDEYTGKQGEEEEDMDISNISTQEFAKFFFLFLDHRH